MDLYSELKKRNLPPLRSREEMREIMQREVFGYLPNTAYSWSVSEAETVEARYMCGTVVHSYVMLTVSVGGGSHTFRVDRMLHTDGKKRPLVLCCNTHPMIESPYIPREELSEYDADFLVFCHKDITSNDADFSSGLASLLLPNGQDTDTACGKIAIWAWASMRVLDYGLTLDGTDGKNLAIAGHSRLGKMALYAAMMDERFTFVLSNASGCTGSALAHGNSGHGNKDKGGDRGELIEDILRYFPHWFCKNYGKYTKANVSDEFDQHYLVASIAPRCVMIGSCDLDLWADPASEQLCALAASKAWERLGLPGLIDGADGYLAPGRVLFDGYVGYYKLHTKHFFSRYAWQYFLAFIERYKR